MVWNDLREGLVSERLLDFVLYENFVLLLLSIPITDYTEISQVVVEKVVIEMVSDLCDNWKTILEKKNEMKIWGW